MDFWTGFLLGVSLGDGVDTDCDAGGCFWAILVAIFVVIDIVAIIRTEQYVYLIESQFYLFLITYLATVILGGVFSYFHWNKALMVFMTIIRLWCGYSFMSIIIIKHGVFGFEWWTVLLGNIYKGFSGAMTYICGNILGTILSVLVAVPVGIFAWIIAFALIIFFPLVIIALICYLQWIINSFAEIHGIHHAKK